MVGSSQGFSIEKCAHFAWTSGAYVTTVLEDFGMPVDEEQIWAIYEGNARVRR